MARKIVIVSDTALDERWGGVPLHTSHLMRAFPDALQLTSKRMGVEGCIQAPHRARALGEAAMSRELVAPDDLIIADGFWGCGFPNPERVVTVVHGMLEGRYPGNQLSRFQIVYFKGCKHLVAVSNSANHEVDKYCGVDIDEVIMNSVDTDLFKLAPILERPRLVGTTAKGDKELQPSLKMGGYEFKIISGHWPDDIIRGLQQCAVYTHISKHEGNAYSILEAMACGLPVVGTPVGLLWDSASHFGPEIKMDVSVPELMVAIEESAAHYYDYRLRNRAWVEDNCNLSHFIERWHRYVETLA